MWMLWIIRTRSRRSIKQKAKSISIILEWIYTGEVLYIYLFYISIHSSNRLVFIDPFIDTTIEQVQVLSNHVEKPDSLY